MEEIINYGHTFASSSIVMALLAITSRALKIENKKGKTKQSYYVLPMQGTNMGWQRFLAVDSKVYYLDCHVRSLASGHTPWLVQHNTYLDSLQSKQACSTFRKSDSCIYNVRSRIRNRDI